MTFTYEIYVFERSRWVLESSFTADRRRDALDLARRIRHGSGQVGPDGENHLQVRPDVLRLQIAEWLVRLIDRIDRIVPS